MNKHLALYSIIFLVLALSVSAVTINSVTVSDTDTFYSSYAGNNIVHLNVTLAGYNTTSGNVLNVAAYFTNLATCKGQGAIINLTRIAGTDMWTGSCDVTDDAAATSFKTGNVTIMATELQGYGNPYTYILPISLYNMDMPAGNACYKFIDGTTNLSQVTDFGNLDLKLVVQAYGSSSCIPSGYAWGNSWRTIGQLRFLSASLNTPSDLQKFTQLLNYVNITYSSSKTFQNNRIAVDSSMTSLINSNQFIVDLYHLPFLTSGAVISDNSVVALPVTWTNNGADAMWNGANTYNLSFTATRGFSGYTITDNVAPKIAISSPLNGQSTNLSNTIISATINSTGTELSQLLFSINGVTVASYTGNNGSNTANCTVNNQSAELYTCTFTLSQGEGTYNLLTSAYDYGANTGNVAIDNRTYIIQMGPPTVNLLSPANSGTYTGTTGSMLKLSFNATDGNGIDTCAYTLNGPVNMSNKSLNCTTGNIVNIPLYLSTGTYNLSLSINDSLGMAYNNNISFTVTDTLPSVITSNTPATTNMSDITLSAITDESAACKYDTTDRSYSDMASALNDAIISHTANISLPNTGTYNYYIRCKDISNNTNTNSFTISVTYSNGETTTPSNTTTTPKPKGDPSKDFELGSLPAGMKVLSISVNGLPVTEIVLNTNRVTSNVQLTITAISKPSVTYSEKVYKYIQVEHTGVEDKDLNDVKIKFKIERRWLSDNNIDSKNIVLLRYNGNEWTPLETSISNNDDNISVYYLSDSPGLSLYAISTKTPAMIAAANSNVVASNTTNNSTDSLTLLDKKAHKFNWWIVIIIAIIVFIIIMLFILIDRNEKYSPPPIFPEERTFLGRIKRLFK